MRKPLLMVSLLLVASVAFADVRGVTIVSSGDRVVRAGSPHVIQVSVVPDDGSPSPAAGTIDVFRKPNLLCCTAAVLVGSGTLTGGSTVITADPQPFGTYTFEVVYSGDGAHDTRKIGIRVSVVQNAPLVINATIVLANTVAVFAAVPDETTAMTMYHRARGTTDWFEVPWFPSTGIIDNQPPPGVVYEYRLGATIDGNVEYSNIDSALRYSDQFSTEKIKAKHFTELRDAINSLRAHAGFAPFAFDETFGVGHTVQLAHYNLLRAAVVEAREALGMLTAPFDETPTTGTVVKLRHIVELRNAAW